VYRVENGRAQDLASLLNETLGTGVSSRRSSRSEVAPGREVMKLSSRATQPSSGLPLSAPSQRGAQFQPIVSQLPKKQTEPPLAIPPSGQVPGSTAPPPIRITADDANNLLLIYASPADYRRIANVLREIDRPPLQVMINATIVEVTLNDTLRYGVQVFLKGKHLSGGVLSPTGLPLVPNNPGLNFIVGSLTDPKVVLDALSDVTEVKVVSSPSVVVVDNQPAILKVGDEVPISTQQASILDPTSQGFPVVNSIQFRDTGVILKVIPRVNSSGLVTMDIEQARRADADAHHLPAPSREHHLGLQRADGGAGRADQRAAQQGQERRADPEPDPGAGRHRRQQRARVAAHRAHRLHSPAGDPRLARCARRGGGAALAPQEHGAPAPVQSRLADGSGTGQALAKPAASVRGGATGRSPLTRPAALRFPMFAGRAIGLHCIEKRQS
jgi:hypothetical protein